MKRTQYILLLATSLLLASCGSVQPVSNNNEQTLQATLWVQNASEYKALSHQAYSSAIYFLLDAIEDPMWTASLDQMNKGDYESLPPAIILDIDETILDNSPFQARMIMQGTSFNNEDWNKWCMEANAEAIPGSIAFTNYAVRHGVHVFYISNRDAELEDATRQNMADLGFPLTDSLDTILLNGEQPDWTSSKVERRKLIEENYRIIMMFGDDLNDFLPAKNISPHERDTYIADYADYFGIRWFMLPNPVYGSWEQIMLKSKDGKPLDFLNTKD